LMHAMAVVSALNSNRGRIQRLRIAK